jgi:hypothetical protein
MTEPLEVIASFMDGERVDADAFKRALGTEEGRDYLVDLVALRAVVERDTTALSAIAPRRRRLKGWLAAAAAVTVLACGSYLLGARTADSRAPALGTPAADPPPAPTRVIELEPGVNWTESSGGK